ncbi:MAG: phage portal protein [Ruminococcus sp.]|nr:phage portal protein [Ruminococcus sp.]
MKLTDIIQTENPTEQINALQGGRQHAIPDVARGKKALDPKLHDINDPLIRKDKKVRVDADDESDSAKKVISTDGEAVATRTEKVARIALALQRLIINRAVSFCFGNPVEYNATPTDEQQEAVLKALKRILSDVKTNSLNRKIGRAIFGFKECAELWYPVEKEHNKYGFPSKFKLRCALFSPAFGDVLYPYFDDSGDMVAFSRAFSRKDNKGVSTDYFETYTDEEHWLWVVNANGSGAQVAEGFPKAVAIGKIPVIYGYQPKFETEDVDKLIDRLELLLSNFADTNDYHASPKIFCTGTINGWAKKGESGAVIEGEPGATMQYVSWANAPEAVKLEIETLLRMIYTITQTPDISFDSVKGLGAISGLALKLLFMDAHLKVQDKREIFDEYLQRRANVLLAYIAQFNTQLAAACDELEVEPEITPYILTSEIDDLNYWMTANGNKAVISQEESIEKAGLSGNPELTMQKIKEQTTAENSFLVGEPILDA